MEDMISKIIEMDERARKIVDEGKRTKVESLNEIAKNKEQLRESMLKRARKKVEAARKLETERAQKRINEIEIDSKKRSEIMNKTYNENCDIWVDTIVKQVLGE